MPPADGRPALPPQTPRPDGNPPPYSVVALEDVAELEGYVPSWDDLAAAAVEPNVFYESWMLLPALRAYGDSVRVVLVFANHAPRRHGRPLLCGLFPLVRQRRGLVPVLCLWHYLHCYLGVPLVRAGYGPEVLEALFDWLAHDRGGAPLLECGRISGEGAFFQLLVDHAGTHRRELVLREAHTRALLRNDGRLLLAQVPGERRKKLRKAEQRLAKTGPVDYVSLAQDGDVEAWLDDFLRLEASGWKLQAGTALGCHDADRQFFLDVARAGRPIAMLCNFHAGDGSFAFKVAFNEDFSRYSPGALLELENLRQVEASPALHWMDSCTDAGESLVRHLWADRRIIQTVLLETGRTPGGLALAVLPLWRWLRRRVGAVLGWLRHPGRS
jgi:CelD/BcsL family acetyltransferase involved in cellulose biosynthesis